MAYLIHKIEGYIPEEHPYYFCDANVWIAALKYYGSGNVSSYEQPYQDFILAIINLNETKDPALIKKIKNQPKIVLTSLLLSEIINAYMRNVAMKTFFGDDDTYKTQNFKSNYRDNPHSDYKKQLKDLCSDIAAFQDYTIVMDDDFNKIDPFSFLPILSSTNVDFNDLYYFHYLKDKGIPLVTHDKDCKFEDIPIITAQKGLLKHSTI